MEKSKQQWKVLHDYHDYSHVTNTGGGNRTVVATGKSGRSHDAKFPILLHYILGELEKEGKSHVMGWMSHGRAFIVRDQKRLEEEILPNWFRQKKFHSFQRQLNIYGFLRLTSGPDKGSYYHELFLRGKRFLSERIVRIKIKGEGPRKPNSPETEPNLYLYPAMGPSESEDDGHEVGQCGGPGDTPRLSDAASSLSCQLSLPMSSGLPNPAGVAPGISPFPPQYVMPQYSLAPVFADGASHLSQGSPSSLQHFMSMQIAQVAGPQNLSPFLPLGPVVPPNAPPPPLQDARREHLMLLLQQQTLEQQHQKPPISQQMMGGLPLTSSLTSHDALTGNPAVKPAPGSSHEDYPASTDGGGESSLPTLE